MQAPELHKPRTRDVIILGGGLAGLSLAILIKERSPELDISVLERQSFPRARAVTKVGESTVEIGSHYLADQLHLRSHLQEQHLKKFGIRLFLGDQGNRFEQLDEIGASRTFEIDTYQIDRGVLENQLLAQAQSLGIEVRDSTEITSLTLGSSEHRVAYSSDGESSCEQARWVVDASGRAALIKNQRQLSMKNGHRSNAVWFRINKRIVIDEWGSGQDWHTRCHPQGRRWLSTNHLTGPGYWVWIIPLEGDVTSIGIVMDDTVFKEANFDTAEGMKRWMRSNQARCAEAMEGAQMMDYVCFADYSYDCKQLYSDESWAITGEAGIFTDPLYSPGTDFIAINNQFIADLICSEAQGLASGNDKKIKITLYEKMFRSITNSNLSLYVDQYGGFGDRHFMGNKILWDYSFYWGVLSLLYFSNSLCDLRLMSSLNKTLQHAQALNTRVQKVFNERAKLRQRLPVSGTFMDQYEVPALKQFNEALVRAKTNKACSTNTIEQTLQDNVKKLEQIAQFVESMLLHNSIEIDRGKEKALLGDYRLSLA